jgi:hypothetical protein
MADWHVEYCGCNQWVIFNSHTGQEYKDDTEDYYAFNSQRNAQLFIDTYLRKES